MNLKDTIKSMLPAAAGSLLLAGCTLWHDDLPDCPTGIDVAFVYDYNVERADMFSAHVGSVTVYAFDADGRFVMSKEESNTAASAPLRDSGYRMHLDLPPGDYRLVARAFQCGSECRASRPGAKFRIADLRPGDDINLLTTTLDRQASGIVDNEDAPLDTLWAGMTATPVTIRDMEPAEANISLMRDTKELHISLRQLDEPAAISADDFEVTVTARNSQLAFDNSLSDDSEIVYTPWKTWTTEFPDEPGTAVEQRTANMQLSLSRLVWRPAGDSPAMLTIRNRNSGAIVASINLPDCLAKGRNAFELAGYTAQEFLDREYDYSLDFILRGDKWAYARLGISVLGWSFRIQPTDL